MDGKGAEGVSLPLFPPTEKFSKQIEDLLFMISGEMGGFNAEVLEDLKFAGVEVRPFLGYHHVAQNITPLRALSRTSDVTSDVRERARSGVGSEITQIEDLSSSTRCRNAFATCDTGLSAPHMWPFG